MFKTTRKFLDYFGLKDLSDLPTLEDLKKADIIGNHLDIQHMQTKLAFQEQRNEANAYAEAPEPKPEKSGPEPSTKTVETKSAGLSTSGDS